jgi:hypothetical protein
MAGAALIVELVFSTLGLVPPQYDAAAPKSNLRWLRVPDLNLPFDKFLSLGGTIGGNIADLCRVGKSGSCLPT